MELPHRCTTSLPNYNRRLENHHERNSSEFRATATLTRRSCTGPLCHFERGSQHRQPPAVSTRKNEKERKITTPTTPGPRR
uniref:Uncharacterized protein n=1 Tax=Physcomitrium patens TaxID=3218 RepID=A0A2K1JYI4_PHYPA|nr:hypothetical protein PHYPA_013694 [Physcomitrium patens]